MGDAERSAEEFRVEDGVLFAVDFFGLVAALSNVVRVHQVFTGASDFSALQLYINASNRSILTYQMYIGLYQALFQAIPNSLM